MLRRAFLKRMALAAAACAFIDVPWPKRVELGGVWHTDSLTGLVTHLRWILPDGREFSVASDGWSGLDVELGESYTIDNGGEVLTGAILVDIGYEMPPLTQPVIGRAIAV